MKKFLLTASFLFPVISSCISEASTSEIDPTTATAARNLISKHGLSLTIPEVVERCGPYSGRNFSSWGKPAISDDSATKEEEQVSSLGGTPLGSTPTFGNAGFDQLFISWTALFGGEEVVRKSITAHQEQISAQERRQTEQQRKLDGVKGKIEKIKARQEALEKLIAVQNESSSSTIEARVTTEAIKGKKLVTLNRYKETLDLPDYKDESITTAKEQIRRESEELGELNGQIPELQEDLLKIGKQIRANKLSLSDEELNLKKISALTEEKKARAKDNLQKETSSKISRIEAGKSKTGKTAESAAKEIAIARGFLGIYDLWKAGSNYAGAFETVMQNLADRGKRAPLAEAAESPKK
jgi:predicted  nucleic acid-binding Zn-ribbon protein